MNKTKILLIQIAGCLALGTVLGVAFWLNDGGKASVKIYQGRWIEDTKKIGDYWSVGYLEVIE